MGIYIKGMKMPKEDTILIVLSPNGAAYIEAEEEPFPYKTTAIELPPHGDLIDRDEYLVFSYTGTEGRQDTFDDGVMFMIDRIDDAPTIIPAEGGENP